MRPSFTLGIEEEYQTIDPETRDLRSHIATEMLAKGKLRLEERVKAEMHQSVIEVGTRVCSNIQVAQEDLFDLRRNMISLAEEHGLVLVAGATHPFADWRVQEIYPDPRYAQVVEDLQLVARANLIFGLHVHVGIEDREAAIRIMNSIRYFLPPPHPRALHQLSLLARHGDRLQELPRQGLRKLPAHQPSRQLRQLLRVRKLRQPPHQNQLHRQRQKNLVGRPPSSLFRHRRGPHLRHPPPRPRDHRHRRAHPGHGLQTLAPPLPQHRLPPILPRSLNGEQIPRRTLRSRRQDD